MAITFESIQDPYGIQKSGSILGQSLMQRGMEDRREQSQLARQRQMGQILGGVLGVSQDPSNPIQERLGALQSYISQTGDTSIMPLMKQLMQEAQTGQTLQNLGLGLPQANAQTTQPQENPRQAQPVEQQKQDIFGLADQQLIGLAASGNPALKAAADAELKRRDLEQKKFQAERKYHSEIATPFAKKMSDIRGSLPKKQMALKFSRDAFQTGNLGYFSLDKLADITGSDLFRTAKGAQLITAGKENLLNNMSRVSARAQNLWFEQRLNSMFPKIGQSKEANLTTQEMLEGEDAIDEAQIAIYDRLVKEDMEKYGYERRDIERRLFEELKPVEEKIMNRTSYRLKQIEEQEKGVNLLRKNVTQKVPKGTPLTRTMFKLFLQKHESIPKAIENAKKLGYTIYPNTQVEEFEQ